MNNSSKKVNSKNLKKNVMYFIQQNGEKDIAAYFDKVESVKYLRFKNIYNTPLLVRKNSKFYYPYNNNNNNKTRK